MLAFTESHPKLKHFSTLRLDQRLVPEKIPLNLSVIEEEQGSREELYGSAVSGPKMALGEMAVATSSREPSVNAYQSTVENNQQASRSNINVDKSATLRGGATTNNAPGSS